MKRVILCGALAISASSFAGDSYFGFEYSMMDTELEVTYLGNSTYREEVSPSGLNLKLGHKFTRYIGMEGAYGLGIGDESVAGEFDFGLDRSLSVSALFMAPASKNSEFYARLGLTDVTYDDSDGDDAGASGLVWALGMNIGFNESVGLTLEYVNFPDGEYDDYPVDIDTTAINAGLRVNF